MEGLKLSEKFMYYAGVLASAVPIAFPDFVEDLKHISDLLEAEEQGLLLKLPCKVGELIYGLVKGDCGRHPSCLDNCECCDEAVVQIAEGHFDVKMLDEVGKTIFVTLAEAEKALAEMEK